MMDARFRLYNIVLDMDGVVFNSEPIKIAAFASLFATYPEKLSEIGHYNRTHRGIPRSEKFAHVLNSILGLPAEERNIQILGERYKSILARELSNVPLVRGIEQFLQLDRFSFFLNSSAPIEEIQNLLKSKALAQYFQAIYGYPYSKVEVLRQLKSQYQENSIVFFGDAWADYHTAQLAEIRFIGVDVYSSLTFDNIDIPVINDFSDLDRIVELLEGRP
jgi:phosphoglycolate phosphatase-like HAD superfamily hydrolase